MSNIIKAKNTSETVKAIKQKTKLRNYEIAEILGVSHSLISYWASGKVKKMSVEQAIKIFSIFKILNEEWFKTPEEVEEAAKWIEV